MRSGSRDDAGFYRAAKSDRLLGFDIESLSGISHQLGHIGRQSFFRCVWPNFQDYAI